MEQSQLLSLAQIVLSSSVLDYFIIVSVESTDTEIHIHLDEKMKAELSQDIHYESKGFMPNTNVTDFPIRDHKVILVTCRTLDDFYLIDRRTFEKQHKEILNGCREWRDLGHADKWLVFQENIGPNVAIDESSLSNGELYTFVTNRDRHCGEGCLIAIVEGTKSEDVADVLERNDESKRESVKEATLGLSDSMRKIVNRTFPKAKRVIDRFHFQKLACDAVQEIRIRIAGMQSRNAMTKWKR